MIYVKVRVLSRLEEKCTDSGKYDCSLGAEGSERGETYVGFDHRKNGEDI